MPVNLKSCIDKSVFTQKQLFQQSEFLSENTHTCKIKKISNLRVGTYLKAITTNKKKDMSCGIWKYYRVRTNPSFRVESLPDVPVVIGLDHVINLKSPEVILKHKLKGRNIKEIKKVNNKSTFARHTPTC